MLQANGGAYHAFAFDNWGANPSATPGTSVIPGASNAEGSWTQVASAANMAFATIGFHMQVLGGATATTIKDMVLDVGVDPAGGTAYVEVIANLVCGSSPSLSNSSQREWYFPLGIPAGASVAVRVKGAAATAGTVFVAVEFFGQSSNPIAFPVGQFAETIGTITNAAGVTFTPGNAADGTWVSLGTTAKEMWWWQLGYQVTNTVITNEFVYIEVAFGDVTSKHRLLRVMHVGSTSETVGASGQTNLCTARAYCEVPAGATIYIRGRCNNAPDTGYNGAVIGIGG